MTAQVNWWPVHTFVEPLLDTIGEWPMVGTQAWCELAADDPRKWAALADAAQHWALRVDNNQQALCDAGEALSKAENWSRIAQSRRDRAVYEADHPWVKWGAAS